MHWDQTQLDALQAMGLTPMKVVPMGDAPAELSPALQQALARAAGCEVSALFTITAAMAADTAEGKRALWPRLRAWRRQTLTQP